MKLNKINKLCGRLCGGILQILNFGESYLLRFLSYHLHIAPNHSAMLGPSFKVVLNSEVK